MIATVFKTRTGISSLICCFLLLAGLAPLESQGKNESPVIALVKAGGWIMYTGPDFILYESGLVLFKRRSNVFPPEYFAVNLTSSEVQGLTDRLPAFAGFADLEDYYRLTNITDGATKYLLLWKPIRKVIGVYGPIRDAPKAFMSTFEELDAFDYPDARPWLPEEFEVSVYCPPKSELFGEPIPWPTHWPSMTERPAARFYVPRSDYEILKEMFPAVGKERLVKFGHDYFKVQYTIRIPQEELIIEGIYPRRQQPEYSPTSAP